MTSTTETVTTGKVKLAAAYDEEVHKTVSKPGSAEPKEPEEPYPGVLTESLVRLQRLLACVRSRRAYSIVVVLTKY